MLNGPPLPSLQGRFYAGWKLKAAKHNYLNKVYAPFRPWTAQRRLVQNNYFLRALWREMGSLHRLCVDSFGNQW